MPLDSQRPKATLLIAKAVRLRFLLFEQLGSQPGAFAHLVCDQFVRLKVVTDEGQLGNVTKQRADAVQEAGPVKE
eukprot:3718375-Prymnesium_polylepis.1